MKRIEIYGNKIIDNKRGSILAERCGKMIKLLSFDWLTLSRRNRKEFFNFIYCKNKIDFRRKIKNGFYLQYINNVYLYRADLIWYPEISLERRSYNSKEIIFKWAFEGSLYLYYKGYFIAFFPKNGKEFVINRMFWDSDRVIRNCFKKIIGCEKKKDYHVSEYVLDNALIFFDGNFTKSKVKSNLWVN